MSLRDQKPVRWHFTTRVGERSRLILWWLPLNWHALPDYSLRYAAINLTCLLYLSWHYLVHNFCVFWYWLVLLQLASSYFIAPLSYYSPSFKWYPHPAWLRFMSRFRASLTCTLLAENLLVDAIAPISFPASILWL